MCAAAAEAGQCALPGSVPQRDLGPVPALPFQAISQYVSSKPWFLYLQEHLPHWLCEGEREQKGFSREVGLRILVKLFFTQSPPWLGDSHPESLPGFSFVSLLSTHLS